MELADEKLDRAKEGYYEELRSVRDDALQAHGMDPQVRQPRNRLRAALPETMPDWTEKPEWALPASDILPYDPVEIIRYSTRVPTLDPRSPGVIRLQYLSARANDAFTRFLSHIGPAQFPDAPPARRDRLGRSRFGPPIEATARVLDVELAEDDRRGEFDLLTPLNVDTSGAAYLFDALDRTEYRLDTIIPPLSVFYEFVTNAADQDLCNPLPEMEV